MLWRPFLALILLSPFSPSLSLSLCVCTESATRDQRGNGEGCERGREYESTGAYRCVVRLWVCRVFGLENGGIEGSRGWERKKEEKV